MASRYEQHIKNGGGGGSTPSDVTDHFGPRYVVGNVNSGDPAIAQTGTFRYIPDPGDGSGIALAVTESAVDPGDIWIRPGSYLWTGANRISIPANRRVYGSGPALTTIRNSIDDNTMFELASGAQLAHMTINHVGTQGVKGSALVQVSGVGALVDDVSLDLTATVAGGILTGGVFVAGSGSRAPTILRKMVISLPAGIAGFAPNSWMAGIRGNSLVLNTEHVCVVEDVFVSSGDAGLVTLGVEMQLENFNSLAPYNLGVYSDAGRVNISGRQSTVRLAKGGELAGLALLNSIFQIRGMRIRNDNPAAIPAMIVTGQSVSAVADIDGNDIDLGFNPAIQLGGGVDTTNDVRIRGNRLVLAAAAVPIVVNAGSNNTLITANISRGSGSVGVSNAGTGTQQLNNIWGA